MTTYEGPLVEVNKSADELKAMLSDYAQFEQLFPEDITYFKAYEDGFTFQLGSMPKVGLTRDQADNDNELALKAAGGSIDFRLVCRIEPVDDTHARAQLRFQGEFNPMIKMMVEKPLKRLLDQLSEGIAQH